MYHARTAEIAYRILSEDPRARAAMAGSKKYPHIQGEVLFYRYNSGTIVVADIDGLPQREQDGMKNCYGNILGFHIHDGSSCTGDSTDPFKNSGMHYNPGDCQHPWHAGDMPVLFENHGTAWCAFYTDRFTPEDVIGKTVIIHDKPDDYRSQPSGDSGNKIACGVIQ